MFFVSDSESHKKNRITGFIAQEPMIAVLLAAANFEWTVGRCILFFGKSPNVDIRSALARTHGLDKYKDLWRDEICKKNLSVLPLSQVVKNWQEFQKAFEMRHRLIHGRGTCTTRMATDPVEQMLVAVSELYEFANNNGMKLNARTPVRRRP